MRIVLLGKPGSGKGTQAARLSRRFGCYHLSSGEVLREHIRNRTPFGSRIEDYVLRGEIGPEKLITAAILDFIENHGVGDELVLDGFPRTLYQAQKLDDKFQPDLCILLDISDGESLRRLAGRYICENCNTLHQINRENGSPAEDRCSECGGKLAQRDDDRKDAIETRLRVFREDVQPVISHYSGAGILHKLDGSLSAEEVSINIRNSIMRISGPN